MGTTNSRGMLVKREIHLEKLFFIVSLASLPLSSAIIELSNACIQDLLCLKSLPSMALDSASPWRNDGLFLTQWQ